MKKLISLLTVAFLAINVTIAQQEAAKPACCANKQACEHHKGAEHHDGKKCDKKDCSCKKKKCDSNCKKSCCAKASSTDAAPAKGGCQGHNHDGHDHGK